MEHQAPRAVSARHPVDSLVMKGIRLIKRLASALRREDCQFTYAQCGEDRILQFLFGLLGISKPSYLDIGAHHPTHLSNTYLFYRDGARGVCVEPDPRLCRNIKNGRPHDTCLNIGIAAGDTRNLNFYVFNDPTMNTFSEEVKDEQLNAGLILCQQLQVEVQSINSVIARHFESCPNLISLDTEGMDMAILETFDFDTYRPEAFCIETLTNVGDRKMTEIIDFMIVKGYVVYADTFINTIFVEEECWNRWLSRRDRQVT
jgi:FkbM family methyltransferase